VCECYAAEGGGGGDQLRLAKKMKILIEIIPLNSIDNSFLNYLFVFK
jgi:hypothetical protein